ncbi:MAG: HIT family protein [Candidatus Shikimatogenerans sp. JK-2022]|nr:HIT family protein [Candidatus Shikimatogenerans bostrichidophilus]
MENIFQKIIKKEKKSHIIYENKKNIAILDIYPVTLGHTLVIPKNIKDDYIFSMNTKKYLSLMKFSYFIANILKKSIKCKRISLSVVGLEIKYVHVHLIPINKIEDLNFLKKKKKKINEKKLNNILKKIKKKIK